MLNKWPDDSLTPLQQRWLVVSLLLVLALIVGLIIIMPVVNKVLELREAKSNLVFKLQQYERILAAKETTIARMDSIKQQNTNLGYFNGQETDALASAEMQELLKNIIVNAGGELTSTQVIPSEDNSSDGHSQFNRILVKVSMTGNSKVLRSVLYKIENAVPLMIIDQMDIKPVRGRRNSKTGQIDPSNQLDINFQAVRFTRKPPK